MSSAQSTDSSPFEPTHSARSAANNNLGAETMQATLFCAENGAYLEPQSPQGWLVWTTPTSDGNVHLLGCIEEKRHHVELLQLREGKFSWEIFDTLPLCVISLLTPPAKTQEEPIVVISPVALLNSDTKPPVVPITDEFKNKTGGQYRSSPRSDLFPVRYTAGADGLTTDQTPVF